MVSSVPLTIQQHKNDPRDRIPPLQGLAEWARAVQPGQDKAMWWPESSLSVSKGGLQERRGQTL